MTPSSALDSEHLRRWIGREDAAAELLTPELARRFRAMLDMPEGPVDVGSPAPPMIHYCLSPATVPTAELARDGHPKKGGFLPPVPLPRRMSAGADLWHGRALRIGDVVVRRSRIEDVTIKSGKSGDLCFVCVSREYHDDWGLAIRERQDIVYREAFAQHASPPSAAPPGEHTRPLSLTPVHLFRYSALTFNAHRIHYDRSYALDEEHYPGLVVHGPLQATLLFNLAAELADSPPLRFVYRGRAPLFDDDEITLNASNAGEGLNLWTAKADGGVCMSAEAGWSAPK